MSLFGRTVFIFASALLQRAENGIVLPVALWVIVSLFGRIASIFASPEDDAGSGGDDGGV